MSKNKQSARQLAKERQLEKERRVQQQKWLGGVGAFVLLIFLIGGTIYRQQTAVRPNDLSGILPANQIGAADAPVQIVEFGDFACHSCRQWHQSGIKEQLLDKYGDQIQITFRHFPVISAQSPKAAEASQCAAEQDSFWAFHDYIYESTVEGALGIEQLQEYGAAVGLDTDLFNACLSSGKHQAYVSLDRAAAFALGAQGTPTFFVNGEQAFFNLAGLIDAIDKQLDE